MCQFVVEQYLLPSALKSTDIASQGIDSAVAARVLVKLTKVIAGVIAEITLVFSNSLMAALVL